MLDFLEKLDELGGIWPAAGDAFAPVSEQELAALERDIGNPIPLLYREFMRSYGASAFGEMVTFRPEKPLPESISSTGMGGFSHFFGAAAASYGETLSIAWNLAAYRARMPETLIPIGSDGGGDLICLGVGGDEIGRVYYWDHNNEWDKDDYLDQGELPPVNLPFQNLHLISHSFEDFIERLVSDESD